jgi:hypothetical protein
VNDSTPRSTSLYGETRPVAGTGWQLAAPALFDAEARCASGPIWGTGALHRNPPGFPEEGGPDRVGGAEALVAVGDIPSQYRDRDAFTIDVAGPASGFDGYNSEGCGTGCTKSVTWTGTLSFRR